MERKQIVANVCVASLGVIFLAILMWYRPDMASGLLMNGVLTMIVVSIIMWRARVDQRTDERTIQLVTRGSRNAFMFLAFAMPFLAGFSIAGVILIDAFISLMLLWAIALGIAWISFFYYYTR